MDINFNFSIWRFRFNFIASILHTEVVECVGISAKSLHNSFSFNVQYTKKVKEDDED